LEIVEEFSSVIGDAAERRETLNANHRTMVKFKDADDDNYAKVLRALRGYVEDVEGSSSIQRGQ